MVKVKTVTSRCYSFTHDELKKLLNLEGDILDIGMWNKDEGKTNQVDHVEDYYWFETGEKING